MQQIEKFFYFFLKNLQTEIKIAGNILNNTLSEIYSSNSYETFKNNSKWSATF